MISIIVPFSGATLDLLPDLDAATHGAELIIVDNASEEATAEALQSLPKERGTVIRNETNLGFAAGNNQGYAAATGDIIIFLNSDVAADPSWLALAASDVKEGALYGPSLGQQLVAGRWLPYIEGWCVAGTRATWEKVGVWYEESGVSEDDTVTPMFYPWDANAYPGPYWEDNDLCLRALQAGLALVQTQWPIQHKGGRTAGPIINHGASFAANERAFTDRVLAAFPHKEPSATYARYQQHCQTQSDIQHHLPLLYSLAHGSVLELGTRSGVSTTALLAGVEAHKGKVCSIDIEDCGRLFADNPLWSFWHGSSTDADMAQDIATYNGPFSLILIDTDHFWAQTTAELALWGPHVAPGGTICLHDPETFPGVRRAAQEYADAQGWPITFVLPNNGMAVIERPL